MMNREAGIKIDPAPLAEKLERETGSHKGENGKVAVVGGSADYTGAPALAAKAALRTGCDLLRVSTSSRVREVVAGFSENLIVEGYGGKYLSEDSVDDVLELLSWSDAAVIGPGLGNPKPEAVRDIVDGADVPLVVDADAIPHCLEVAENAVFTPHRGELEPFEQEFGSADSFSRETGNVVLVKGEEDLIYDRGTVYSNTSGSAAMTVGGTGDVLSGTVASLISQGLSCSEAARLAAWLNGRAGELAENRYGNGLVATDLPERIPEALGEKSGS